MGFDVWVCVLVYVWYIHIYICVCVVYVIYGGYMWYGLNGLYVRYVCFMAVSFREDGIVFAHNDWGKGMSDLMTASFQAGTCSRRARVSIFVPCRAALSYL